VYRSTSFLPALLAGVLASIALSACTPPPPLRLAIHPWPGYAFIFMAREEGWLAPGRVSLHETRTATESLAALAEGQKLQVVHLQEVPDQTTLDALLEEEPAILSLNRRIQAMSKERKVNVDFDAVVTHELVRTVNEISRQTHCEWLVSGWDGRSHRGLFVRNPVGRCGRPSLSRRSSV